MRDIKFRVWDNVDYISSVFTLQDLQDKKIQFTSDCVVMQYTGFKDKNGKEIYEGDIFRVEENGREIDEIDRIYFLVVVWVKEWGMFCTLRVDDEYFDYQNDGIKALDEPMFWTYTLEDTDSKKFYLCGNIFEHKHLLKK